MWDIDVNNLWKKICQEEKFDRFLKILTEYNQKYNLTAITEKKEVYYKHFLDSSAGAEIFTKNARVLEVGSGAGFPSLVLKILRPDLQFTLLESVGKKCLFLREAVKALKLSSVNVIQTRAEDVAKGEEHREKYDGVCARAVARLNTLSEYCIPFLKKGGLFVAYKSGEGEEVREAERGIGVLGGKIRKILPYELPEGYGQRALIVIEKIEKTPLKYPRGNGKERKCPL